MPGCGRMGPTGRTDPVGPSRTSTAQRAGPRNNGGRVLARKGERRRNGPCGRGTGGAASRPARRSTGPGGVRRASPRAEHERLQLCVSAKRGCQCNQSDGPERNEQLSVERNACGPNGYGRQCQTNVSDRTAAYDRRAGPGLLDRVWASLRGFGAGAATTLTHTLRARTHHTNRPNPRRRDHLAPRSSLARSAGRAGLTAAAVVQRAWPGCLTSIARRARIPHHGPRRRRKWCGKTTRYDAWDRPLPTAKV
jgi:hypothetical protein